MKPGDVIADRFEVQRLAGRGGMSAVYRCLDRVGGAVVAVKVLLDSFAQQPARFAREAQVLASLHHPNIVRYFAHGSTPDGQPWLAMEWLDGEDLAAHLSRRGITPSESVVLATRVASALAAIHARGVLHRDLKPGNLLLPEGDLSRVKLLDFGVARVDAPVGLTRTGVALGTPGYMAPSRLAATSP